MVLVLDRADLFPVQRARGADRGGHHSVRAAVLLHLPGRSRHIPANLLSIGAIDFGIIVDGSVVMVENIFRELAARARPGLQPAEVIREAANDVERPIFYSIAVIIAGYCPSMCSPALPAALPAHGGHHVFRAVGRAVLRLTLLPVLCSYWFKKRRSRAENRASSSGSATSMRGSLAGACDRPKSTMVLVAGDVRRVAAADSLHRRRVHAAPRRRRAVGARHHALHHFLRGGLQALAADPQHPDELSAGDRR